MEHIGKVLSLYISDTVSSSMLEKVSVEVDTKGIIGDKHYDRDVERSILITSLASYTLLLPHNIHIPHSSLGENLLIDYNPYHLPLGTQLQIGNAILEITQNCTLCKHLAIHDKRIPKLLKDDRGIFAKVVQDGKIKKDDHIYLL